jgi:hypothetical protein
MWLDSSVQIYRLLRHLTVAALLVCVSVVPGLSAKGTSAVDKSKSPIENEEESLAKFEGLVVINHRRVHVRLICPAWRSAKPLLAVHVRHLILAGSSHFGVEGHYLSNELLAPLTC